MRNQRLPMLLSCAMIVAVLSGCSGSHTHQMPDHWDADLTHHWKDCTDCGETAETAEHTLDEDNRCTICGAQIVDWGDSKSLYLYNDNGDMLKMADYDPDGNVRTATTCQYEYDSDGLLTRSTTTTDGVLAEEYTYTAIDGESVVSQCISYMDDGSKFTNDYDECGNVILLVSYDAEWNVDYRSESEYALSSGGEWYESKCTATEQDGSVTVGTFSENDQIGLIRYDAEGDMVYSYVWEYTYDDDGNWQTRKFYCDDVLKEKIIYNTVTVEDESTTYPEIVTEYHEDGTQTVTTYDENGEVIS